MKHQRPGFCVVSKIGLKKVGDCSSVVVWNEDEEAIVKVEKLQTPSRKGIMYYLYDSDVMGEAAKVEYNSKCDKMYPSAAEFRRGNKVTSA